MELVFIERDPIRLPAHPKQPFERTVVRGEIISTEDSTLIDWLKQRGFEEVQEALASVERHTKP